MPKPGLISLEHPEVWQQQLHIFLLNNQECRVAVQAIISEIGVQTWQVMVFGLRAGKPISGALMGSALEAGILKWAAQVHQDDWPMWSTMTFLADGTIAQSSAINQFEPPRWWPIIPLNHDKP